MDPTPLEVAVNEANPPMAQLTQSVHLHLGPHTKPRLLPAGARLPWLGWECLGEYDWRHRLTYGGYPFHLHGDAIQNEMWMNGVLASKLAPAQIQVSLHEGDPSPIHEGDPDQGQGER